MSQAILDQFITKCRQINSSFRTDEGKGLFQKKSSLYGLLECLRRQIKLQEIKPFLGLRDALSHCENPNDPRIVKYRTALNWLVDAWGHDEPDASHVLLFLRRNPKIATAKAAFTVMDPPIGLRDTGGKCSIECKGRPPAFSLTLSAGGVDWYVPYAVKEAKSVLVPFGEPDGTLVVTWPMNGCALEVRQEKYGNRFFHDADGKYMPNVTTEKIKFRSDYSQYGGLGNPVETTHQEMYDSRDETNILPGQFHFDLITVKKGGNWHVCQSASFRLILMNTGKTGGNVVFKSEINHYLGSFPDKQ